MKEHSPTLSTTERYIGIGELARESGCKPETVRYYERIGLLPSAPRNEGNQRRYTASAVRRLTFIRHARDFGFSVEAVRELLQMADYPAMPCEEVDTLAKHHLAEVEARLARLTAVLSDHRLCEHSGPHGGADVIG